MKKYYCSESELFDSLGEEGKEWEYVDSVEGCLQDNFIIGTNKNTIFVHLKSKMFKLVFATNF